MYTYSPQTGLTPDVGRDVERLLLLAKTLESLQGGAAQFPGDLTKAPLIDEWKIVSRPIPILLGRVTGHPELSNSAALSVTSEVWIDGSADGWIRTFSRFYRIGGELQGRPSFDLLPKMPWVDFIGEW